MILLSPQGAYVIANKRLETACDWARSHGSDAVVEYLSGMRVIVPAYRQSGIREKYLLFDRFLNLDDSPGAPLRVIGSSSSVPYLYGAAKDGDVAYMKVLLDCGADICERHPKHGFQAIHTAANSGNTEAVKLLLEQGCDVNARDNNGNTALHFAAGQGHLDVCKMLVEAGECWKTVFSSSFI